MPETGLETRARCFIDFRPFWAARKLGPLGGSRLRPPSAEGAGPERGESAKPWGGEGPQPGEGGGTMGRGQGHGKGGAKVEAGGGPAQGKKFSYTHSGLRIKLRIYSCLY